MNTIYEYVYIYNMYIYKYNYPFFSHIYRNRKYKFSPYYTDKYVHVCYIYNTLNKKEKRTKLKIKTQILGKYKGEANSSGEKNGGV